MLYELLTWRLPWTFANMTPFKVGRRQPAYGWLVSKEVVAPQHGFSYGTALAGRRYHQAGWAARGAGTRGAARPRHSGLGWAGRLRAADAVRGVGRACSMVRHVGYSWSSQLLREHILPLSASTCMHHPVPLWPCRDCWAPRPEDRPSFDEVVGRLRRLLAETAGG